MITFWDVNLTLLEGLVTTGKLFALTLLFALPLGLLICLGSMSRFSPLRYFVKTRRMDRARFPSDAPDPYRFLRSRSVV